MKRINGRAPELSPHHDSKCASWSKRARLQMLSPVATARQLELKLAAMAYTAKNHAQRANFRREGCAKASPACA